MPLTLPAVTSEQTLTTASPHAIDRRRPVFHAPGPRLPPGRPLRGAAAAPGPVWVNEWRPGASGSVREVSPECLHDLFSCAAQTGLPLAVSLNGQSFVAEIRGTVGAVAVHGTERVASFQGHGLVHHWDELQIGPVLLQRSVSASGLRHAFLVFDALGQLAWWVTGDSPPDRPERCAWRELVQTLADDDWPAVC